MNDPGAVSPRLRPATPAGARAFIVTPFARMARTHAASTMADAMVAASLAGSLFFSLPAGDARGPVLRYLVITMLPFAVISPLIGPAIDRLKGGHRFMVIGSSVFRALLCYLMARVINGGSVTFFLYALCLLVAQKAYQVARSALVPTVVVSDDGLVEANSKLSLISGLSGFVGILPAAALLKLFGPQWSLRLGIVVYLVAALLGTRIKSFRVAVDSADEAERHELRGAGIIMAGSAMGLIRACVGFLTLLVAFDFRGGDRPAWQFGVVGAASVASQLAGAAVAPRIRSRTTEENLLTGVLGLLVAGGVVALLLGDVAGAATLGACVGFSAGAGKLAFDSILQRDAPDANRGRAFARFETRFQVTWVIGALVPVAVDLSATVGFALILVVAVIALGSYVVGRLSYAHQMGTRQTAATAAALGIEARFADVSGEVKGRLAQAPRAAYRRVRTGRSREVGAPEAVRPGDRRGRAEPPATGESAARDLLDDDAVGVTIDATSLDDPHTLDDPVTLDDADTLDDPETLDGPGTLDDDGYDEEAEPQWAGEPISSNAGTGGLAGGSSTAWLPPDDGRDLPWEPPSETSDPRVDYLDELDPAVDNPFPWTPDG